jgi:hypothetical protein
MMSRRPRLVLGQLGLRAGYGSGTLTSIVNNKAQYDRMRQEICCHLGRFVASLTNLQRKYGSKDPYFHLLKLAHNTLSHTPMFVKAITGKYPPAFSCASSCVDMSY